MSLAPQVVMITGAAGQLGRHVARAFAEAGATRVLVNRRVDDLQAAFGADDDHQMLAAADLLDAAQVEAAAAAAVARFGRVDALCHLAGGFRMGDAVHGTGAAIWNWLFDINVRTLLNVVQAVVPRMIDGGGGSIVTVGALSAQKGQPHMGAYSAAKSAVQRLSEAMDAELRGQGIRVNCVLPGVIDTPQNRADMPGVDPATWVAPADLAQTMLWLTSDPSRAVHGTAVPLAGG